MPLHSKDNLWSHKAEQSFSAQYLWPRSRVHIKEHSVGGGQRQTGGQTWSTAPFVSWSFTRGETDKLLTKVTGAAPSRFSVCLSSSSSLSPPVFLSVSSCWLSLDSLPVSSCTVRKSSSWLKARETRKPTKNDFALTVQHSEPFWMDGLWWTSTRRKDDGRTRSYCSLGHTVRSLQQK